MKSRSPAVVKRPTLKNSVNPLTWQVPITNRDGTPTDEFMRKWGQQASTNGAIPDLTTAAGVSAHLDLLGSTAGMLLERSAAGWAGLASPNDPTKFLNGAALPAYAAVKDSDLAVTDITTNNVSIAKHGFAPKAPNDATKYLDGTGVYSTPPSGGSGGGGASSIYVNASSVIFLGLVDSNGVSIVDSHGYGVYANSFPVATPSILGIMQGDGYTNSLLAGVLSLRIPGLLAGMTIDQAVTSNVYARAIFDSIITNVGMGTQYSVSTGLFTPTKAGLYFVWASGQGIDSVSATQANMVICKNGTYNGSVPVPIGAGVQQGTSSSRTNTPTAMGIVSMNGTTDTLEADMRISGSGTTKINGSNGLCFFGAIYLGN
jgi:hypothetical protein